MEGKITRQEIQRRQQEAQKATNTGWIDTVQMEKKGIIASFFKGRRLSGRQYEQPMFEQGKPERYQF